MYEKKTSALQRNSNRIRQAVFERLAQHIRESHNAEEGTCWTDRFDFIAWLMHSLALTEGDCERLKPFVAVYDKSCPCQPAKLFSDKVLASKDAAVGEARAELTEWPEELVN